MSRLRLFGLVAVTLLGLARATITITDSGARIASRPDRLIGRRFIDGYEYMARLQHFPFDQQLCPPMHPSDGIPFNLTVTIPSDGLPVALLAQSGGCSMETKARLASFYVHPSNVVKYLIVYDPEDGPAMEPESSYDSQEAERALDDLDMHRGSWNKKREFGATVGILHVNARSGNELIEAIQQGGISVAIAGGPRLLLDGKDSAQSRFARNFLFWMGLSIMISACLLSFALSFHAQNGLRMNDEVHVHATTRPSRRRLTVEQLTNLLPELEYNGHVCVDEEGGPSSMRAIHEEMCSICLDEFIPRDKCRCLPCDHTFHSTCIAKWLIERSATCPLCKSDLIDDDEHSDGSDHVELREGSTQTGTDGEPLRRRFFTSFFSNTRPRESRTSWWQRRLSREPAETVDLNTIEQPLLEEGTLDVVH